MAEVARLVRSTLDFLRGRKRAYQLCFGSPAGAAVLIDLSTFCRAAESCYHDDPRKHAVLEGRREVWLRIAKHMNMTPDQLFAIYSGRTPLIKQEDNDDG